jgi:hypothetical protein
MKHTAALPLIRGKFDALASGMDERLRRRWAATEALALGWGGISAVSQATGLDRNTIAAGVADLKLVPVLDPSCRVRQRGGGRKSLVELDPGLLGALDDLVDPATRGDPQSPLRWTCKSTRLLAESLTGAGHPISPRCVAGLLVDLGYSLQANRKTREGASHPDRNAQFEHINDSVGRWRRQGQPVISVDTKKKELVGDFKNQGREWQPAGEPEPVRVHDFVDPTLGKAIPYGVYDLTNDQGWVSVGIDHDTAEFAAATITRWWDRLGSARFPNARRLLITADGGGSNSHRSRLWKVALQGVANRLGLPVSVCHFPPGTSKWNKIEHRLFCQITKNWRGRPLVSHQVIVNLIGNTRTKSGMEVHAELDTNTYQTKKKVTDEELARVQLKPAEFHGEWNYTISPTR